MQPSGKLLSSQTNQIIKSNYHRNQNLRHNLHLYENHPCNALITQLKKQHEKNDYCTNLEIVESEEESFRVKSIKHVIQIEVGVESSRVVGWHGARVAWQIYSARFKQLNV